MVMGGASPEPRETSSIFKKKLSTLAFLSVFYVTLTSSRGDPE